MLLIIYWYLVFRDFGTRWTTSRQLQGHEYLDRDDLIRLGCRLLVVIGGKDLITPATALDRFLSSRQREHNIGLLTVERNHHGLSIVTPSVMSKVLDFIDVRQIEAY